MNPTTTLFLILGYFAVLFVISWRTGRKADAKTFFNANKSSPWYLVAFGMIGASLSGVTFISIPGAVGNDLWHYFQIVFGYLLGYAAIALILMPLYYKLNLLSIYGYLEQRIGVRSYKMGAIFFLLSRIVGASLRLYLVTLVLQLAIMDAFGIPFAVTVLVSIILIYLYTFRGGIKTVVWTDTLQTFFMLAGAAITAYLITKELGLSFADLPSTIRGSGLSEIFVWEWAPGSNFFKQFISGAFIALAMTGLDQDMMQKNLTCRNLGEAQKNVFWFSVVLIFANLLFLSLGVLLYVYGFEKGIVELTQTADCAIKVLDPATGEMLCRKTDQLFPLLSLNFLGPVAGSIFVLGVIAAAYSSADSALTALTTSFCVDILDFEKKTDEAAKLRTRYLVHIGFATVLFFTILIFNALNNDAVIWEVFRAAGYTYGPILGMFAFGMFTPWQTRDKWVPVIAIVCPLLTYLIAQSSIDIGFLILPINGLLTFVGLWLVRERGENG